MHIIESTDQRVNTLLSQLITTQVKNFEFFHSLTILNRLKDHMYAVIANGVSFKV